MNKYRPCASIVLAAMFLGNVGNAQERVVTKNGKNEIQWSSYKASTGFAWQETTCTPTHSFAMKGLYSPDSAKAIVAISKKLKVKSISSDGRKEVEIPNIVNERYTELYKITGIYCRYS